MATNRTNTNKTTQRTSSSNSRNTSTRSSNTSGTRNTSSRTTRNADYTKNGRNYNSKGGQYSKKDNDTYLEEEYDNTGAKEILVVVYLALAIFLICSNFGWCGFVGRLISKIQFGLAGTVAYILPVYFFVAAAFYVANGPKKWLIKKIVGFGLFIIAVAFLLQLLNGIDSVSIKSLYMNGSEKKLCGGFVFGGIISLIYKLIGLTGSIIVIALITIIGIVVALDFSLFNAIKESFSKDYSDEEDDYYEDDYEYADIDARKNTRKKQLSRKRKPNDIDVLNSIKVLESDNKKVKVKEERKVDAEEIHELKPLDNEPMDFFDTKEFEQKLSDKDILGNFAQENQIQTNEAQDNTRRRKKTKESYNEMVAEREQVANEINTVSASSMGATAIGSDVNEKPVKKTVQSSNETKTNNISEVDNTGLDIDSEIIKEYKFPPIELLKGGNSGKKGSSEATVKETAYKLKKTLENFGVNVAITDYSCGPAVTRYELQPEQGVKVSKIVNLADDIKLNLAAADIRIEAPIPGKAAIGIEVPNKEATAVYFRELLESENFKKASSNISFAVGKDISGQVIVTDIAKMPHLLIAGSTGSGKSVCINTLIMSILYKANPNDVKLIMVDPKQVELSIYNGIPHMLIPVVTDPKKAAGALNWAVMEMTNRYQLFAQYNVRNLQGYNEKVKNVTGQEEGNDELKKLPQIVIVVDELADLMMVAHGEVEDAIVRLSQLARAAGIHLVIATQRPSVDVITGLIKANVPSRIAMTVSQGVDSRTILDMNGAEKLLGKGDMLFYPTGYPKPVRVQGAFLSDEEIADVVDFLKNENSGGATYDSKITEEIENTSVGSSKGGSSAPESEYDDYFADAGRFIIGKDKASIGMLQRVYKIGFNRAARIMDQLSEAGVVGPEEGTKPRKVLMTMEEFENYVEEYL